MPPKCGFSCSNALAKSVVSSWGKFPFVRGVLHSGAWKGRFSDFSVCQLICRVGVWVVSEIVRKNLSEGLEVLSLYACQKSAAYHTLVADGDEPLPSLRREVIAGLNQSPNLCPCCTALDYHCTGFCTAFIERGCFSRVFGSVSSPGRVNLQLGNDRQGPERSRKHSVFPASLSFVVTRFFSLHIPSAPFSTPRNPIHWVTSYGGSDARSK
jgi:hypothetical protein